MISCRAKWTVTNRTAPHTAPTITAKTFNPGAMSNVDL